MRRALELAQDALYLSSPNPRVGCVIVNEQGEVLGEGATQMAGGAHAEIVALRNAATRGHPVTGATVYVTLEPCSHQGRTGPCCDALVAAGVQRVVAAIEDPNPLVQGQGFARLRAADIAVETGDGAEASRNLNIGFFSRMQRKTPWVRMKIAASLDGQTALDNGQSQWITGDAARADGHAWRARACAILTGIGTVRDDDPRLDVRRVQTPRQPHLVVVDSHLETPPNAQLFRAPRAVWIYAAARNEERQQALQQLAADIRWLPDDQPSPKVDLQAMLLDLGQREINELHVEAGHKLNGSLLRAGLVDELLVYFAPRLIGAGRGMAALGPLSSLSEALDLQFDSFSAIGADLRILARVTGRPPF